jgi:3-hydroxy-9,10-secoandrosta-1,3,5(10)-triene-9,17-dione monooxygenase
MGDHAHIASGLALEAQQEIWGEDPGTRICASFVPVGKARSAPGGVILSGRHSFASGIDHARWALAGGTIVDGERQGTRCLFLVPLSEASLIDDWRVMGMAGTGSKSFELKDVFVPSHRILTYNDMDNATGAGARIHTAPVYRMPHGGLAASAFACIAVGIAEGFLADYLAITAKRVARGVQVAEMMGTQIGLAAAAAEIEAAGRMYLAPVQEAMAMVARGEPIPRERRRHAKRNAAFASRLALGAVERLFNAAGSRVLFEGDALQRQFRDLHAAAAHAALVWDVGMSEYGRSLLGLE